MRESFPLSTRSGNYGPISASLELARASHHAGDLKKAEALYRQILAAEPNGEAAAGLGALLRSESRQEEAGELYSWALKTCQLTPILLNNACNWLREAGRSSESLPWLTQGLQRWPKDLHLRWGLALSLHHSGQPRQALRHLEALLVEQGERPLLIRELVACFLSCEQWDDALATIKKLRRLQPNDAELLQQELNLLNRLGQHQKAWTLLQEQPLLEGLALLRTKAILLLGEQRQHEALPLFAQLVQMEPNDGDHWLNLAACQKSLKQMVAPLRTLQTAISKHPNRCDLIQALGSILVEHGRWSEGLELMLHSANDPRSSDVQQFNLQFAAAGNRLLPAPELARRALQWEQRRRLTPNPLWNDHLRQLSPTKRLRIGYFSQDLHNHPVGRFIKPLLTAHDREHVEVIGISCGCHYDSHSDKIKHACDGWLSLNGLRDLAAARKIAELELDIIVELGGYTGGQRLRLLTARPAPIQLSYLGYFASTHLDCIDGWIGDEVVFPPGLEQEATGQVLHRLPRCYMTYQPESSLTPRRTAPDNRFRFGSFNHSRKLTDPTLDLFAAVLQAVPNSMLVLKSQTFGEVDERKRIRKRLEGRGIQRDQIELLERSADAKTHLSMYGHMDAALDPIPYGGATTTAEALWMGVPLVCLAGEGMVGRLSASVVAGAGLEAAIAVSVEGYVDRARRLAAQGPRTNEQRLAIRKHMQKSALMDSKGLAGSMEQTFRACWQSWLESTNC